MATWHESTPAVVMLQGGSSEAKPQLQPVKQLTALILTDTEENRKVF